MPTSRTLLTQHSVNRGGVRLALWEKRPARSRPPPARTLLLVHGATFSGRVTFDIQGKDPLPYSLMDILAASGYDVFAVDLEGYGSSDHPDHPCPTEIAVQDVEATMTYLCRLRAVERVHLLGFSWGTQIAGCAAVRTPDRVHRLILFAPISVSSPWLTANRPHLDRYRAEPRRPNIRSELEARLKGMPPAGSIRPDVLKRYLAFAIEVDPSSPNGCLVDCLTRMPLFDYGQLSVPTLLVHGEHDDVSLQADLTERFRQIAHPFKIYAHLPALGHLALLQERRDLLYRAILDFLALPDWPIRARRARPVSPLRGR
ncbi:MAG: alpha/beta fold hydrolase [Candidatus Methylomirabilales bacterium]